MSICSSWALFRAAFLAAFISVSTISTVWAVPTDDDVEYRYDDLGRLVEIIYRDQNKTHRYTYDDAGNRSEVFVVDGTPNTVRLWNAAAVEGQDLRFGVWRVYQASQDTIVNYETYLCEDEDEPDYKATPGVDYVITSGSVTITGDNLDGKGAYIVVPTLADDISDEGVDANDNAEVVCMRLVSVIGGEIDPDMRKSKGRIFDIDSLDVKFSIVGGTMKESDGKGNGGKKSFWVTRTGNAATRHSVVVKAENGTAIAGKDFIPFERTLTFWPESDETQQIIIQTMADNIYEGPETFNLTLSQPSDGSKIDGSGSVEVTINDVSDLPKVLVSQSGVREGDSQADTWHQTGHQIWTSIPFETTITVNWVLCYNGSTHLQCAGEEGLTVTPDDFDDDVTDFSGTLTLTPETPEASLFFGIRSDLEAEADEQYVLKLYDPEGAVLDPVRDRGYGTIRNDDDDTNSIFNNFGAPSVIAGEPLEFTVRRWGNASGGKTLQYSVSAENTRPNDPAGFEIDKPIATTADYVGGSGDVVFASNSNTATFTIDTIAPSTSTPYVGDKVVPVTITGETEGDTVTVRTRGGLIVDPNIPVVTVTGTTKLEGSGLDLVFDFDMDRPAAFPVKVYYATTLEGTAGIEDFVHKQGFVEFKAHENPGDDFPLHQRIGIKIRDDIDEYQSEGDETVVLALRTEKVLLASDRAVATIRNDPDDMCGSDATRSNSHMTLDSGNQTWESDGGTVITVNLRTNTCPNNYSFLEGGSAMTAMAMQGATAETHEYKLEVVSGTAEAGTDFENKSITIGLSALADEQHIPLEIIDDLINETDEDLVIRITPLVQGDTVDEDQQLIILDDDPGAIFSVSDVEVSEGSTLVFGVTKTGEADRTSSLVYRTVAGSALEGQDYIPVSGTLTFEPSETYKTVSVQSVGNSEFEYDEQFTLLLSDATGAGAIERAEALATIKDDDPAPAFTIADSRGMESEDLMFTLVLDRASAFEHSVRINTVGGSATEEDDFLSLNGLVTFAPGETIKQLAVNIDDDNVPEPDENFSVRLSDPTNGAVLGDQVATLTIEDNDSAITFANEVVFDTPGTYQWTVPEGVSSVHVVAVGGGGAGGLYSQIGRVGGGGGGLGWKNNIPVTPGEQIAIEVGAGGQNKQAGGNSVFGASIVVGEGGTAYTSAPTDGTQGYKNSGGFVGDGGGYGGDAGKAAATGNDVGGGGAAGYSGSGGRGISKSSAVTYNGESGTGGGGAGGGIVSSEGASGGGVGLYGEGASGIYSASASGQAGSGGEDGDSSQLWKGGQYGGGGGSNSSTSEGGSGAVRIMWGEGRSFPNNAQGVTTAPVPDGTLRVSASIVEQHEGEDVIIVLEASGNTLGDVQIDYATLDNSAITGADYSAASGSVIFGPGETIKLIRIATIEDMVSEAEEDFSVSLSVASGSAELAQSTVTVTIIDDDLAPSFNAMGTDVTVQEGSRMAFTVTKSLTNENTYTVAYETIAVTATANDDYIPVSSTLTFEADETAKVVYVETVADETPGDGGTVLLRLSNPSSGSALQTAEVIGTILDDDSPTGEVIFATPGTHQWTVPAGVSNVSVVAVGAGAGVNASDGRDAGGGGALAWKNNIPVVPGQSYTVVVGAGGTSGLDGGNSAFEGVTAGGGGVGRGDGGANALNAPGGTFSGAEGGGNGGWGRRHNGSNEGGGGGAGGYMGDGGDGFAKGQTSDAGLGGGGSGGSGGGGGGVGLMGEGASGSAVQSAGGQGGSGGVDGQYISGSSHGGTYGAGAGGYGNGTSAKGGDGAVRIVWGTGRSFPHNAGDQGGSNPTPMPTVSLSISDAVAMEGDVLLFTVTAVGASVDPITIDVATTDGSAIGGQDFTVPRQFVLEPYITSKTIAVSTVDNAVVESTGKTFSLTLSSTASEVTFAGATATGTITDND